MEIKEFHQNGELVGKLYLGDCLEILPTMDRTSCMIAVTSPPHNLLGSISNRILEEEYSNWYNDSLPEYIYQGQQQTMISELLSICKSSIFYNHKIRYAWHNRNKHAPPSRIYHPMQWLAAFPIWCEIIWDRNIFNQPQQKYPIQDERIYQIGKPTKWDKSYSWGNIWRINPCKNNGHVCSYPIELVNRCLLPHTDPGDWIIDPYIGSGTTAISCIQNNRRFIGIERNPEYFQVAMENIERELVKDQQIRLWG